MNGTRNSRDITIDTLRGIAILVMVYANMGPAIAEPHSWPYRMIGSLAAPAFILLAGMMVTLGTRNGSRKGFSHFLWRGVFILAIAALIDVGVWRTMPFVGVDVLYLIGVAIPLAYLAARAPLWSAAAVTGAVLGATPFLQQWLGYTPYPLEYDLNGALIVRVDGQTGILNHWLVDGGFPLFPWLGYVLAGTILGRWRWEEAPPHISFRTMGVAGLVLVVTGGLLMHAFPGPLYSRGGYTELFYPVTPGFMLLSLGFVVTMLWLIDLNPGLSLWNGFRPLGEAALLMYILHCLVLERMFASGLKDVEEVVALLYLLLLIVPMGLVGLGLRELRTRYPRPLYAVRWVTGG